MDGKEPMPVRKPGHRLLVAVGSTAESEGIVRWAAQRAAALGCPWIALHVEAPHPEDAIERSRVMGALALAGSLGAEVMTITNNDLVHSLLRVASQQDVTQIIVGKPPAPLWRIFQGDGYLRRLIRESADFEVHVVGPTPGGSAPPIGPWQVFKESTLSQYLTAISVVVAITMAASILGPRIVPPHSTALIFLLGVVVLGSFVGRGPTLLAAFMSAILWDYFFLPPVHQFRIDSFEDGLIFGMYFIVALIMGQLTTRIREQRETERLGEERATALFMLSRELTEAATLDQMVRRAVGQMERVFDAQVAAFMSEPPGRLNTSPHPAGAFVPTSEDLRALEWAFAHRQRAGRFTGNVPEADALYAPLVSSEAVIGVIGLRLRQTFPPTVRQLNLLDAFLEQIVLALERLRMNAIAAQARVLAESERLTKTLLDSMSHEVRTPIAAITSATSTLVELEQAGAHPLQKEMVGEIQEATGRLNRLVGNFLDVTRLESGAVKPNLNECEVSDLVHTVLADVEKELSRHQVAVALAPDLPLVRMDFVLMQQALGNLLSNAAVHTPPGTQIELSAQVENGALDIVVADHGRGIPVDSLPHLFDKFYRAPKSPDGGTGLGLSLVKGFMEAQGGRATVENRPEGGARFTLHLPLARQPDSA